MKHKVLLFVTLFACSLLVHAQSKVLRITKTDNSVSNFEVSLLNKVLFNDSTMIIKMNDGSVSNIPVNTIRSFVVRTFTGINEIQERPLLVYPNPAVSDIHLLNLDSQTHVASVYAVTGQLMLEKPVSAADNTLDVSVLKQGVYVLRLNGQTIKFTKK